MAAGEARLGWRHREATAGTCMQESSDKPHGEFSSCCRAAAHQQEVEAQRGARDVRLNRLRARPHHDAVAAVPPKAGTGAGRVGV